MLRGLLSAEGCKIGRRHVTTLMRRMGIEALYRRPRLATASRTSSTLTRARSSPAQPSPVYSPTTGIAISMDGKGTWRDNVFVERLWRSVKYEEVYLRAYDSVSEARASIGRYLDFTPPTFEP